MRTRLKVVQGGTFAGKTYAIIPIIIDFAIRTKGRDIVVVAETITSVSEGALKIFLRILDETGRYDDARYNATKRKYTFPNGTTIRFTSFDTIGKAKAAGKFTDLFINEANYIPWPIADTLIGRCDGNIWLDYNPDDEFWAHTEILVRPDASFLVLTYRDNEAIPANSLQELMWKKERAKTNPFWANWWKVYGEGQIGQLQGACFPNVTIVGTIPRNAQLLGYGMDFGYTNDPTTIIACYRLGENLYFDELLYQTGLSPKAIRREAEKLGINMSLPTVADNNQMIIDEIKGMGSYWWVIPAHKPPGSVKHGITFLNGFYLHVTSRSTNMITESRKLIWATDVNGRSLNEPKPGNDHCWDGARYLCTYKLSRKRSTV